MTTKTQNQTSNKIFSRTDSVNRRTFATCLRLFGICVQLMACDAAATVAEYHSDASHIEDYVMVSAQQ